MAKHAALLLLALAIAPLCAEEGKWAPDQVLRIDPAWLKQQGLEIPPSRLWDPQRGTGLLAGAISLGGCSASFISETGLIITNHHCVFSILQQHSTPANDIITKGFLARSRDAELSSKTVRVTVPRRFTDVTKEVLAAVPAGATDLQRYKAIEAKQKQLVADCEQQKSTRCSVSVFDDGVRYVLIDSRELSDVRLVYAPPRAVGEYGGEVDNWAWPRHTGDFSIARAYVAPDGASAPYDKVNVPYKPEFYFPISSRGVSPGDFVMVLGYPGATYRSLIADEMAVRRDLFYPRRVEVLGEWIRNLEETTKGSPEGTIAVAATLKTLFNSFKNAQGQIAGFRRGRILEKQRTAEDTVLTWATARPEWKDALAARRALVELVNEQRATWDRDFLVRLVPNGPKALSLASTLVRAAIERNKPDMERDTRFMERNVARLRAELEREQKSFFAPADKAMLATFVRRALALPEGQRISAIDDLFGRSADSAATAARIDALYAGTKVMDLAERMKMFSETEEQLRARKDDPFLQLAFSFEEQRRLLKERDDAWQGRIYRLRPAWRAAVIAHAGKPVAFDANSSLRVTFAHVKGYEPRDAVAYKPQTTLSGVIEKHTGEEPFDAPAEIRTAYEAGRFGPWKDAKLKDVPVAFLADADTTGGNSGSPTVNGRGELVGVNFDRVWENVANDFGYNPDIARNVNADVRYLLWILDQVTDADSLLRELGIRK